MISSLGIQGTYSLAELSTIPKKNLLVYRERDRTLLSSGILRAHLFMEKIVNHGSYGNLISGNRITDGIIQPVMVKISRLPEMNLTQEAIIQSLCHAHLLSEGAPWAIPKVYDVFLKNEEVCFSMDQIKGKTLLEWFTESKTPDRDFYLLLAQLSLLLWSLETKLNVDHRDLKADNLLLRNGQCRLQIGSWCLDCPFQVVLLDFGFACLGSFVSLGDGVLPPMDPCPKEGRDLFQLLVAIVSLKPMYRCFNQETKSHVTKWLSVGSKSYESLAGRWSPESWMYLVTSQEAFTASKCSPSKLLDDLLDSIPGSLHRV